METMYAYLCVHYESKRGQYLRDHKALDIPPIRAAELKFIFDFIGIYNEYKRVTGTEAEKAIASAMHAAIDAEFIHANDALAAWRAADLAQQKKVAAVSSGIPADDIAADAAAAAAATAAAKEQESEKIVVAAADALNKEIYKRAENEWRATLLSPAVAGAAPPPASGGRRKSRKHRKSKHSKKTLRRKRRQ